MLHDFTGGERKKGAAQSAETTKVVSKSADSMEIIEGTIERLNPALQEFVGADCQDDTMISGTFSFQDTHGDVVSIPMEVMLNDLNKFMVDPEASIQKTFREYITREMLQKNDNGKNITDDELEAFFGTVPDELSKEMVAYIATYHVLKDSAPDMTFYQAKQLVKAIQEDGEIKDSKKAVASMYRKMLEMTSQSIIGSFKWRIRAPRTPAFESQYNEQTKEYDTVLRPEYNDQQFKAGLIEYFENKNLSAYRKRSDKEAYKVVTIGVSPILYQMLQIAKKCYKGNLTFYLSRLIVEDAEKHGYIYNDVLKECLTEEEYKEYMKESKIESAEEVIDNIRAGVWR